MNNDDLKRIQKVVKGEIAASEQRLRKEISASEKRVIGEIGTFMEDHLFPMIEEKADKTDIDRIESKLDKVIDTSIDHENRLKDIEHVSVVAHELKFKRSK